MTKKEWKLIINQQEVELTTIKKTGTCWNCQEYKEIRLILERKHTINGWEVRKFCGECSLNNLQQLEDVEITNKSQIINELRTELNNHE